MERSVHGHGTCKLRHELVYDGKRYGPETQPERPEVPDMGDVDDARGIEKQE
jgi:hypothetical protein